MELLFNKDIYDFNLKEMEQLLKSYNLSTEESIRTRLSLLKSYINYCVEMEFAKFNLLGKSMSSQWIKSLVPPHKPYLLDSEFEEIIEKCINPQDSIILQLLFEGVGGDRFSELLNLKMEDVNIDKNMLKLNDNGEIRHLVVSEKCIELILKANDQKQYFLKNGTSEAKTTVFPLIESEYVIKKIKKGRHKEDINPNSGRFLISRRIESLADIFGFPEKKPNYIVDSGKVALAKSIYLKDGLFNEKKALTEIIFRFNLKQQTQSNGTKSFPTRLKRFTNEQLMSDLYNLNFEFKPFKLLDSSLKDKENVNQAVKRVRQGEFRDRICFNYLEKCAITNESIKEVLESAHIQGYINEKSHHPQNGILLRVDFHKLFDAGLIIISDNYELLISYKVESDYYRSFDKQKIRLPINKDYHPSLDALKDHRENFKENF
ncbi:HNH endonuclease [Solibacillus sp. FSL H8-0538]|uniref:phage lytic cycle repressor MrpR family protein n=1 Tax=Solibacillus sp. FSL H8-0538 TaxID=2921400 RepID=UPI0030F773D6